MKAQTLVAIVFAVAIVALGFYILNYQRGQTGIIIAYGDEVYFTGEVTQMPNPDTIGARVWQVQVLRISQDPNSHLISNQIINVKLVSYPPMGHVDDDITKSLPVEVYGKVVTDQDYIYVSLNGLKYFMKAIQAIPLS